MKFVDALRIINGNDGFMVGFEVIEGHSRRSDHFPDKHAGDTRDEYERRYKDLLLRAAKSIREIADFAGDDHSVGICSCSDIALADELDAAAEASQPQSVNHDESVLMLQDAEDAKRYRFLREPGNAIVYAKDRNAWGNNASGHVSYHAGTIGCRYRRCDPRFPKSGLQVGYGR